MRIYFYGGTLKAAEKKGNAFVRTLRNAKVEGKLVNITAVNKIAHEEAKPLVKAYKFQIYVEYNISNI